MGKVRNRRACVEVLEGRTLMCVDHLGAAAPLISAQTGIDPELPAGSSDSHVFPEASMTTSDDAIAQSAWTIGNKSVLYIRAAFADSPTTEPQTFDNAVTMMQGVSDFISINSFALTSFTTTVTDLIVLPGTVAFYNTNGDGRLRSDALATAAAANPDWNWTNYNLDAVRWSGGPGSYAGQAYVGARGVWLKSSSVGVAAHEFGHNFGLWHANYWTPTDVQTVIGPGTNSEYGDVFDTMGSASAGQRHFSDYEKALLDWIPAANITNVTTAGLYRMYAHDLFAQGGTFDAGRQYGIKVHKDTDRDYRLDFRQHPSWTTSNRWLTNGIGVRWDRWAGSNRGAQLLDTTPATPDGKNDAGVVTGRTFTDAISDLHITPIARGDAGTTAPWIDVQINFGDPDVTGNQAPVFGLAASAISTATNSPITFTASASDPDGDALAYYWDFGDRTFGANAADVSKSWSAAGEYRVRLTVSDMKGRTTSRSLIINVGAAAQRRITGRVVDAGGDGVADVRVHNGVATTSSSYRFAYTDADGSYTLTDIPTGSTFTIGAARAGYTLTPQGFTNPVGQGAAGINFLAAETQYTITGKVTSGQSVPVVGATVSLPGGASAVTNSAGVYSLLAGAGSHTISVSRAGYTFGAPPTVVLEYGNATRDIVAQSATAFAWMQGSRLNVRFDDASTITLGLNGATLTATRGVQTLNFSNVADIFIHGLPTADALRLSNALGRPMTFNDAGGDDTLDLLAGTHAFLSDLAPEQGSLSLTIAGGASAFFSSSQHFRALTVNGNAQLTSGAGKTIVTSELTFGPAGRLDLTDNDLLINYSGVSPIGSPSGSTYDGVTGMIALGRGGETGIVSSSSTLDYTGLGLGEAAALLSLSGEQTALWNGQTVDATSVLVKHTYMGDANLDGLISGDDYTAIDFGIAAGGFGYHHGDFNFDGFISGDDYSVIDFNIAAQGDPPVTAGGATATSPPALRSSTSTPFSGTGISDNELDDDDSSLVQDVIA